MTKLYIILAALVLAVASAAGLGMHERSVGRQQQQAIDNARVIASAKGAVAKAETVYIARVDTFTRWQTRTATLHDTVLTHLTDTLLVKQYVAATDSTLRACSDVVLSCDSVRARYAALEHADSVAAMAPKPKSGILSRVGVYAGYGLQFESGSTVHHGVQVGVGIRLWP